MSNLLEPKCSDYYILISNPDRKIHVNHPHSQLGRLQPAPRFMPSTISHFIYESKLIFAHLTYTVS